jgi:hypothetical protein
VIGVWLYYTVYSMDYGLWITNYQMGDGDGTVLSALCYTFLGCIIYILVFCFRIDGTTRFVRFLRSIALSET